MGNDEFDRNFFGNTDADLANNARHAEITMALVAESAHKAEIRRRQEQAGNTLGIWVAFILGLAFAFAGGISLVALALWLLDQASRL